MNNKELYEKSKSVLVGGVNSPARAINPRPFFTTNAEGAKLYDIEGKSYIDYCLAFGPMILGHNNQKIRKKVLERLEKSWCFGTATPEEYEYAKLITDLVPNVDKIRCVNTGTEATMTAIRLARGFSGKDKIIKIEGAYHGAHDSVLVKAGSGGLTHSVPDSLGIPKDFTKNTILIPYNDLNALERAFDENKDQIAALITEPAIGNAGCILPKDNYLQKAKKIVSDHEALLILDEVITGFRLALGGAQEYYNVDADIVTMGKIVGGGFPIGVIGARNEIMEHITPLGKVYNSGTFNGHPISITAGIETIKIIKNENILPQIAEIGNNIQKGIKDIVQDLNLNYTVNGAGPMYQVFFTDQPVDDLAGAKKADAKKFLKYCEILREKGIYLPPSQYETNFVSIAHTNEILAETFEKIEDTLKELE